MSGLNLYFLSAFLASVSSSMSQEEYGSRRSRSLTLLPPGYNTQAILGDDRRMELVVGLIVVFVVVHLQLHEQDNVHARGYFTPIKLAHM